MNNEWRPDIQEVFDYYNARVIGRSGEWQKAECPLTAHEDRNPSASVNLDAGKWRCWSCDGHGDVWDIITGNEENLAGIADARKWAEGRFAESGGGVRRQRGSRSGLSVRPTPGTRARNWSPPWRGL